MKIFIGFYAVLTLHLATANFCLDWSDADIDPQDYIGTWHIYGIVNPRPHDVQSKCMYYEGLFVGNSYYIIRHETSKLTDKDDVLVAHSTGEVVDNSYTVFYNNKKREDEVYTTLCFNKDFEISYFGELRHKNVYIYTRKVHPTQEVLSQIYEILAKQNIEPHLIRLVDHVNCGRCY